MTTIDTRVRRYPFRGPESGRRLVLVLGLAAASIQPLDAVPALGAERPVSIDPEVRQAVRDGGARVLVELRLAAGMTPEGAHLTPEAVAAQRDAIAAAQRSVLSRLSGTHWSLLRRYETIPLLLLEIRADALTALEQMGDAVARVRIDRLRAPAASGPSR